MDLNRTGGLNKVRPVVYCAALKLRSLQKLCQMHLVTLEDLCPVLHTIRDSGDNAVSLSRDILRQSLEQLFPTSSKTLPGQVVPDAVGQTVRLLFKLYDREETGFVILRSVEAALVVLSGDTLLAKHRALFQLAVSSSGRRGTEYGQISYHGLRFLLHDLSQIPAVVQESHVFGNVQTALRSCFSGVIGGGVEEEHFVSWLQSEPRLLLWLSTLYRLSVSEDVQHRVRCHTCKAFPITGLRYRCLKCLNVHLCQNCFLTEKHSRKHKPSHQVLEYCTEPSWKESMSSLASNARSVLQLRRLTRSQPEKKRDDRFEPDGESPDSFPIPELSQQYGDADRGLDTSISETTSPPPSLPPPPPPPPAQTKVESKALQTDRSDTQLQRSASLLQKDLSVTQQTMKDLQRDKWLLEKEFQVWKVAAQTEHDTLEDRCMELEGTMESISHHNHQLEAELEQVRHALRLREREEIFQDVCRSPHLTPPSQPHIEDDASEKQWASSVSLDSHPSSISASHEEGEPEKDEEEEETGEQTRHKEEEEEEEEEEDKTLCHKEAEELVVTDPKEPETNVEVQYVGESSTMGELQSISEADTKELEEDDKKVDVKEEDTVELQCDKLVVITEDPKSEVSIHEDDDTDNSEDEEEMELWNLAEKLQSDLLMASLADTGPPEKGPLLHAAEKVGDAIFRLVVCFEPETFDGELQLSQPEEEHL